MREIIDTANARSWSKALPNVVWVNGLPGGAHDVQWGTLTLYYDSTKAEPYSRITTFKRAKDGAEMWAVGWPQLTRSVPTPPALAVQGGRAIEDEELRPAGEDRKAEVVPVGAAEPTTPFAAWVQSLPELTKWDIVDSLAQILTRSKQVQIDGEPIRMEALLDAAAIPSVELGGLGGPPRLPKGELEPQVDRRTE